jgi:hypothetical protein
LYLPLLGLAALAARGLQAAATFPMPRRVAWAAAAALVAGYAFATLRYLPALHDDTALWAYELRLHPESPLLHLYRARTEWRAGRLEAAMVAARDSYARAAAADARTDAAVDWASMRLQAVQGRETEAIAALRRFFDALCAGSGAAHLQLGAASFEVQPTDAYRNDLCRDARLRSARGVVHARSGDYAGAEQVFTDLWRDDAAPTTAANLARALAAQEKWGAAATVLDAATRRAPGDPMLAELRATVQRGASLAADNASPPGARAVQRAQVWLGLGLPALARSEMAPREVAAAAPVEAVVIAAYADAVDGDAAAARARLEDAAARDPVHRADWNAALARLPSLDPAQNGQASRSQLDALFR